MNWWQWVTDFQHRADAAGDKERLRLVSLFRQVRGSGDRDLRLALGLCAEGRQRAQELHEPWWVLGFRAEVVHLLLHSGHDCRRALDLAVAAVLEARKPAYQGCPVRTQAEQDLVCIHFCLDPFGYADQIETAFLEIEKRMSDDFA